MNELTQRVKNKLRHVRREEERKKRSKWDGDEDWVGENQKGIMEGSLTTISWSDYNPRIHRSSYFLLVSLATFPVSCFETDSFSS